ncbi:valine--tRNA ligase [Episyrphus balteatus]|uniref:valine--tRNA ligase n=1 Tax=Episyrphus balteatus TaxID=286459 RepID=UPI00248685CB|nr:valine--tRNA ligase [Episyrphus balteatus]
MQTFIKLNYYQLKLPCFISKIRSLNSTSYRKYSSLNKIAQGYQPKDVESNKYIKWSEKPSQTKTTTEKHWFTMILPPPNVTGNLHLGHALMATIQDVICRHKRQKGYQVQWIPGTDHAGIATQVVVEKKILKERQLSRHDLGREEFLNEVWKWKNEKGHSIVDDLKRLGCSLDWNNEYFTMDKKQSRAVNLAFVRLFNEGLIKRKKALVNWSCSLESAISDIEVDSIEISGPTEIKVPGYDKNITFGQLYNLAYRLHGEESQEIVVSTTRPETILGDIAVAVHPDDERYSQYREKQTFLWHPFRNQPIPLIFDSSVDREFGTGAVKITPAHDKNDFELAKRHSLESVSVISEKGQILPEFVHFSGLKRFEARSKILDSLASQELLREIRPHSMSLPLCSRSKDVIEYILRPQWFVHCQGMANEAIQAVRDGRIQLHPKSFENDWFRWLSDCHDWCISRQLWWGHQIPAYLAKSKDSELWIAAESQEEAVEKAQKQLNSKNISLERDPDVLDTWFSSSLLPFSIFNWPSEEFRQSYPLDVMETGHDILFFWVARMTMLGMKLTGDVPFRNVLLNGIVCDAHGRKMSKSLGNVVTPQQVIYGTSLKSMQDDALQSHNSGVLGADELKKSFKGLQKMFPSGIPECGTDALRFTLCSHNIKSHFINFDVAECYTNKLFLNKIWQATRYTLGAHEKVNMTVGEGSLENLELELMDKWILSRLADTLEVCENSLENYNFHTATAALKNFFYTNFCDVYLETTKPGISDGGSKAKGHCVTLSTCLSLGLQAMSPFTPFISEELQQFLPKPIDFDSSLYKNSQLETEVNEILDICQAIRQLKSRNKVSKKHSPKVHLFAQNKEAINILNKYLLEMKALTLCNEVILETTSNPISKEDYSLFSTAGHLCSFGISTNSEFKLPQSGKSGKDLNNLKLERLQKELEKYLERTSNEGFRKSASEAVQKRNFEKIQQLEVEIKNIKALQS